MMRATQAYGCHCLDCDEIWDGMHVPAPVDLALRELSANSICYRCKSEKVVVLMPDEYQKMIDARKVLEAERGLTP